ncbi:MAG: hypothetical protein JWP38_3682 [Herbaspirillum sp.]|nr:hypothetical protein [Herbaspirillum sp.]
MITRAIYPAEWAEMLIEDAGKKYQPSNGTEGEIFFSSWCSECARDKSMREGADIDECDDSERCDIIGKTMAYYVEDEEYPKEWQYGKDGQPCCTAFIPAGDPIPALPDMHTVDMFKDQPIEGSAS